MSNDERRDEERRQERGGALLLGALILTVVTALVFSWHYGLGMFKPQEEPAPAAVSSMVEGCTAELVVNDVPTQGATVSVGDHFALVVNCQGALVEVVFGTSLAGVSYPTALQPGETGEWTIEGTVPPDFAGMTIYFYLFTDGSQVGTLVMTVHGDQSSNSSSPQPANSSS